MKYVRNVVIQGFLLAFLTLVKYPGYASDGALFDVSY